MKLHRPALIGLTTAILALGGVTSAAASTVSVPRSSAPAADFETVSATSGRAPHASLRLEIGHGKAWLGQALPVTLRAYFRGVEGVTLEGAPELTGGGVFTSSLGHEPHQSTEIIGGEPVLVATWTGTLTPSSAGPLALRAQLPARIRYRDAAPQVEARSMDEDAMNALRSDPFDMSAFDRLFQQAQQGALGRVHEEAATLRASAPPLEVLPLPAADQPPTFSGAVGRYTLQASLSAKSARVSEPLTLKVVVDGDGDLDRVDLAGETSTDDWKAYPMNAKTESSASGKPTHRKVFEQVLVPLREGLRAIPPLTLATFDPAAGRYEEHSTNPLTVEVQSAPPATATGPATTATPATSSQPAPKVDEDAPLVPTAPPEQVRPRTVLLRSAPAAILLALGAVGTWFWRRRAASARQRDMRRAAMRGNVVPFYRAAHDLIEARLAAQWNVSPEEVTVDLIQQRLGPVGDLFADTLTAEEALRFGRAQVDAADLVPLCSSLERCLNALGSVSARGGVS
jgi:hypothetical protein